ncbi:hypothetical protein HOP50_07g48090 [Chloropicon primus]|nr:hypothetical protein HOP50_07g48090 [Chloropicon primus]
MEGLGALVWRACGEEAKDLYAGALDCCAALLQRSQAKERVASFLRKDGRTERVAIVRDLVTKVCPLLDDSFERSSHVVDVLKEVFAACDEFNEAWDDDLVELFQAKTASTTVQGDDDGFERRMWFYREGGKGTSVDDLRAPIETKHVAMNSAKNMLQGNTGCHCWEASFVLYEYVLTHRHSFQDKVCLELGAGCGLLGVGLQRVNAKLAMFTDANEDSLDNLARNLRLNGIDARSLSLPSSEQNNASVYCGRLAWEEDQDCPFEFDVVLGSDITYDVDLVPCLAKLLKRILCGKEGCQAFIAAMPRNEATLEEFVKAVEGSDLKIQLLPWKPAPSFWLRASPDLYKTKLFHITTT